MSVVFVFGLKVILSQTKHLHVLQVDFGCPENNYFLLIFAGGGFIIVFAPLPKWVHQESHFGHHFTINL